MLPRQRGIVGVPLEFRGYAYDFGHRIAAMQFSMDGGATWTTYPTPGTTSERNVCWHFTYTPEQAGCHELRVRSENEEGKASPQAATVYVDVE